MVSNSVILSLSDVVYLTIRDEKLTRCSEPTVIDAFEKIWGTRNLLVSFDGMNVTLPASDMPPSEPWPHVDQNPVRKGMQCVQGILNLAPNGPQDGGLMVVKGSHNQNEAFFKSNPEVIGRSTWGSIDWFGFSKDEVKWFEDRGCELIKVCAEPGDLILWDSRTIHYNRLPDSGNFRAIMYICYTPAAFASEEDLEKKIGYFRQRLGTVSKGLGHNDNGANTHQTHWPHANIFHQEDKHLRLGKPDTFSREKPSIEPEENELVLKLAGVVPY